MCAGKERRISRSKGKVTSEPEAMSASECAFSIRARNPGFYSFYSMALNNF
jgi:hypothetical protein